MIGKLGRYEVLQHLATGGMAEVYLARVSAGVQGFARHVVVKRIRADHADDPRFVRMFLDEARLAATLHHHNVVQVYDVGQEGHEYFIAMEYVHGHDVRQILAASSRRRERVKLAYALAIAQAAAAGLDYAHNREGADGQPLAIVHRDVSPSNVLVGYDGGVKLVDFGIAKATSAPGETRTGTLKGKIGYLSPEQVRGAPVDRRSDVFSLGIVLFELSTTARLFRTGNDFVTMHRIVSGEFPSPSRVRADYPPELERIVMRALAVDPDQRYGSAAELLTELEGFAADRRLTVSTAALGRWITELFGARPEPWRQAPSSPARSEEAWTAMERLMPSAMDDARGPATDPTQRLGPVPATETPVPLPPPPSPPRPPAPPRPALGLAPNLGSLDDSYDDLPIPPPAGWPRAGTTLRPPRAGRRRRSQTWLIVVFVVTGLALAATAALLRTEASAPRPAAAPPAP